jgi:S-adenosylmethionine:tRNA ribosyltransferase-isomerase
MARAQEPVLVGRIDFDVPEALLAHEPPEARGVARDEVRLLVSGPGAADISHGIVRDLGTHLGRGDVLVVNTSATIAAALDAWRAGIGAAPDEMIAFHLSSPVPGATSEARWVVELRRPTPAGSRPLLDARVGERIRLRGGVSATLLAPFGRNASGESPNAGVRLWEAELDVRSTVLAYAAEYGSPIRYGYVPDRWPLAAYQTVFADEPGSAEMPSAGRPFTRALVESLEAAGIIIAPLLLHTGVASLEAEERPYPERYRVSPSTAARVNEARNAGGRVVAVGTTVVRALETVANPDGTITAGEGWTDLVVTPKRGIRSVDALLTGFHEPRASHLSMLETIAGRRHLEAAYAAALDHGYLWHEFGDVHLILSRGSKPATNG